MTSAVERCRFSIPLKPAFCKSRFFQENLGRYLVLINGGMRALTTSYRSKLCNKIEKAIFLIEQFVWISFYKRR